MKSLKKCFFMYNNIYLVYFYHTEFVDIFLPHARKIWYDLPLPDLDVSSILIHQFVFLQTWFVKIRRHQQIKRALDKFVSSSDHLISDKLCITL